MDAGMIRREPGTCTSHVGTRIPRAFPVSMIGRIALHRPELPGAIIQGLPGTPRGTDARRGACG
jgi:hypothetical protein